MVWIVAANIALLLFSYVLLRKQKQHLWRMCVMLFGNLIVLRILGDIEFREDTLIILIAENVFLILATALLLTMRFAPNAIRWREI